MHYYPEDQSRENLARIRRENCCVVCGRQLSEYLDRKAHKVYIACSGQVHEGIAREYKPPREDYQSNIRREHKMVEEIGTAKTQMLAKYEGVTSLDKVGAREVITTVFPEAPEAEIARAILLCVNYQLNPLMNHVYLIPFQRREQGRVVGTDWATVIGRGAKRLMASRRGPYSYIENTPRIMTKEEQLTTFGEYDENKMWCITKLQDPQTGATSVGYGFWPKKKPAYNKPGEWVENQPKGTDKGNSMFNMASGRSETQALDRLRPGEMPMNLPVLDEALAEEALDGSLDSKDYIEGESREGIVEAEFKEVPEPAIEEAEQDIEELFPPNPEHARGVAVKPPPEATSLKSTPVEEEASGKPPRDSIIDLIWLKESVKTLQDKGQTAYNDESLLSYMRSAYKNIEGKDYIEVASKLDKGMATHFTKVIQDALEKP